MFGTYRADGGGGPVHITVSEPSPEAGKPCNALLPLSLDGGGGGGNPAAADRNRKTQSANVSITITDASPDGGCGPKPLPPAAAAIVAGTSAAAHSKRLAFRRASEARIVQHKALVHRTSEGPHHS